MKKFKNILILVSVVLVFVGCKQKEESSTLPQALYISSGQCNSGQGITTYTAVNSSRMISKVDLTTGAFSSVLDLSAPYVGGNFAAETGIQSLIDSGNSIYALTENSLTMTDRKILKIPKASPYNTVTYSNDPAAFTNTAAHITRNMAMDADGTLLFSKSIAVEKIGTNVLRIPMGANPWVNAPAGSCATSNALMTAVNVMPLFTGATSGKLIYAHQGATAALNRLGIISMNGYNAAADCLNGVQISATTHVNAPGITGALTFNATNGVSPTAMVYIPNSGSTGGKLIVAYSTSVATDMNNNSNLVFAIVMWTVTETALGTATLATAAPNLPVVLYRDWTNIFGISAMAYDPATGSLYVSTPSQPGVANATTSGYGYKIEKFALDLTTPSLTLIRPNNKPFLDRSSATKCITGLAVGSL